MRGSEKIKSSGSQVRATQKHKCIRWHTSIELHKKTEREPEKIKDKQEKARQRKESRQRMKEAIMSCLERLGMFIAEHNQTIF